MSIKNNKDEYVAAALEYVHDKLGADQNDLDAIEKSIEDEFKATGTTAFLVKPEDFAEEVLNDMHPARAQKSVPMTSVFKNKKAKSPNDIEDL